ncbi:MAG: OB-fold domain-containing protein [Oscillospiraceae bacterium]
MLECGRVGYALNASMNTISSVRTGERVKLCTYEIIREDARIFTVLPAEREALL